MASAQEKSSGRGPEPIAARGKERTREARRAGKIVRPADFAALLRWATRAALVALVIGLVWGSIVVRDRVRSEPRFDLARWRVSLGELPPWAPPGMREEIAAVEPLGGPFFSSEESVASAEEERTGLLTVFTPGVLQVIRDRFLTCAWVKDVGRVRLRFPPLPDRQQAGFLGAERDAGPLREGLIDAGGVWGGAVVASVESGVADGRDALCGGIELDLVLRSPVALIACGDQLAVADDAAVRLGRSVDADWSRRIRLPIVRGGETRGPRPIPQAGLAWEDSDVREGISVARVLLEGRIPDEFPSLPPITIDVSNVAERARPEESEISLIVGGLRLEWGRSPISRGARTMSAPEIIANLRTVLTTCEREIAAAPEGSVSGRGLPTIRLYTTPPVRIEPVAFRP